MRFAPQVHVRGVGVDGWDGTESGVGTYENEAALKETWQLPPEELFQRILVQINRSKRDILQDKYNQCKDPACPLQTRSVFIRVLKRIAESFMSCLLSMSTKR